ncbi:hypothetical protein MK489_13310 [Myxococcota bacterium]|nr:hypothetical protein [Myxococcota bacterium]
MRTLLRWFLVAGFALFFTGLGVWIGTSRAGQPIHQRGNARADHAQKDLDLRSRSLLQHPAVQSAIAGSTDSNTPGEAADPLAPLEIIEIAPRTWLIQLPVESTVHGDPGHTQHNVVR